MDNFDDKQFWDHSYLALASTISIVLLVAWRGYTRYLDSSIAHLYPEMVYFEGRLSCSSKYGTVAYLKRNLGVAGKFLSDSNLTYENKADIVAKLVSNRLISGRGHFKIDLISLGLVLLLAFIVFGLGIFGFPQIGGGVQEQGIVRYELKWIFGSLSGFGVVIMVYLLATRHKKPSKQQIGNISKELGIPTKSTSNSSSTLSDTL